MKLRATKMATDLPYYVEGYSYDASAVRWFTGRVLTNKERVELKPWNWQYQLCKPKSEFVCLARRNRQIISPVL